MDLFLEIQDKINELNKAIDECKNLGLNYNKCEYEYKIKLRVEALKLKNDLQMPVTLINQVIYGVPEVSELRFKRDKAETLYNSMKDKINVLKLQIRILDSQLQREYNNKYGD